MLGIVIWRDIKNSSTVYIKENLNLMWELSGQKRKRRVAGGGKRIQVYKKKHVHNELKVVLLHFLVWVWAEEEIPKYHQKHYSHSISNLTETRMFWQSCKKGEKRPTTDPVPSILLIGEPTLPKLGDLGRPGQALVFPPNAHLCFLWFTDGWWHFDSSVSFERSTFLL